MSIYEIQNEMKNLQKEVEHIGGEIKKCKEKDKKKKKELE